MCYFQPKLREGPLPRVLVKISPEGTYTYFVLHCPSEDTWGINVKMREWILAEDDHSNDDNFKNTKSLSKKLPHWWRRVIISFYTEMWELLIQHM
jgi:hypothetical protein